MPTGFRSDIQALRGLAVLMVVVYHAGVGLFPAGYLGVDIFFVISGFLITRLLRAQIEEGRFSFRDFYYRRAKRLLPAAYVVFAATAAAAPFFLTELGLRELKGQIIGGVTFTANIALWLQSDYFAQAAETKPLLHVWSLAVEEQYYLLIPAYLVLMPRRYWLAGTGSLLLASAALCFLLVERDPSAAFYLLPTRAWEMAVGSVGALLSLNARLTSRLAMLRLPALALLLIVPSVPIGTAHPGVDALIVCTATLLLLLTSGRDNVIVRSSAGVGDISYSLYLTHWPILVYVRAAWLEMPPEAAIYGGLALAVASSWLLHRFVEEPFRRTSSIPRRYLVPGLVLTSVLLGAAPLAIISASAGTRNFAQVRRVNVGLSDECVFKAGSPPTELPGACRTSDKPRVLLWGDSYAMALASGLAKALGDTGLAQLTMSACGPSIGTAPFSDRATSPYPRKFAEDCIRFNDGVLAVLKDRPEIEIVAITSRFTAPVSRSGRMLVRKGDAFEEQDTSRAVAISGIDTLVDAVRALGKRVVVIAPPPAARIDTGNCLERKARGLVTFGEYRDCEISVAEDSTDRSRTLALLKHLPAKAAVEVVSFNDFLCNKRTCKTEIDGKFLYRDYGHLSYEGAEIIAQESRLARKLMRAAR